MVVKLLGSLLVVTASGLLGIALSNKVCGRPKDLKRFRSLMQMLETEIIYGATPLPTALKYLSASSEGRFSRFFKYISDSLNSRQFFSLRDAWSNGVNEVLMKDTSLSGIDLELIKNFGNVLGCSDRDDQKKHFELFYIQLKHYEEIAEEERKKSSKMYRSLGFLLGIVVVIVLA